MTNQDNTQMVKDIYAAFGRGDIPGILSMLTDDAEITHSGPPSILPWAKTYRGHAGWGQFFKDLLDQTEVLAFEPQEYLAQGEKVAAFGRFRAKAKTTGRTFEYPWAMLWTFRGGGKASSCRVYDDTAALVEALRK